MALDGDSSQGYPVNAGVPKESIPVPTLLLLYINDLPDDIICNIAIYADHTTLYSKCDQACDLWQRLELPSELESDLLDTVDWGRKWLVDFNAGKTQLISFDQSNNTGAIDVKMDGPVLEEKPSFKMLGLTFTSKLDCNGNHVFMVDHSYPWLIHGHIFIFHTHAQECNHSETKTWLTIVIIMVITSFPMVNHSSLKKEYNGRPL